MRNLFKNYRNQDNGIKNFDELAIVFFLAVAIVMVLFFATIARQQTEVNQLAQDQANFREYVNKYNERLYKKVIEKGAFERLLQNGLK